MEELRTKQVPDPTSNSSNQPRIDATGPISAKVKNAFADADITINGNRPWDIQVRDKRFYRRVLLQGSLGLGESYMEGWWDCPRLDHFFTRLIRGGLTRRNAPWLAGLRQALALLMNLQSPQRAFQVGEQHYDIGNDVYRIMLDRRMNYSCGYWRHANTLEQAQQQKLKLIADKLKLEPGMRVLDIGCGWGGLARYLSEHYDVRVAGITISKEQAQYARQLCQGLPVTIRLQDYRDLCEPFDRVVSVGMFEHVGHKNYRTYIDTVLRCLLPEGLFLLHTIGGNRTQVHGDAWLNRYIFPNSMLPSIKQIADATEGQMIIEDWHNFGTDYDKTLMAWHTQFVNNWYQIQEHYDERFYRMWIYYLMSCAAVFRNRQAQLWQIVMSPEGLPNGYLSVR